MKKYDCLYKSRTSVLGHSGGCLHHTKKKTSIITREKQLLPHMMHRLNHNPLLGQNIFKNHCL